MKTKIGVFFGGRSVEHEISVISALQAIAALDTARYEAIPVYITKQGRWFTGAALLDAAAYRDMEALTARATEVYMLPEYGSRALYRKKSGVFGGFGGGKVVAELDVAIPVLHGTNGEDGTFQGFMELIGIPYAGCNVLSSAVGMDKIAMKMMLRESGLPVIDYVWFTDRQWSSERGGGGRAKGREELIAQIEAGIGYPAIVKPANLGSSVGISRARNREELLEAVETATLYSARVIVERMIEPLREINCSVLGSADDHIASVCEEPVRSSEILSYADKYMSGGSSGAGAKGGAKVSSGATSEGMASTKRRIPADLPEAMTAEIQRLAAETFRVLSCEGVARVDFILGGNTVYVNEINAIPGSLSFYLWEATGVPFGELMDRLVAQALKRERDKSHKTVSYSENIFSMGAFGGGAKGGAKTGGFGGAKGAKNGGSKGGPKFGGKLWYR
jgi:D-alanine-D-alanine ligase